MGLSGVRVNKIAGNIGIYCPRVFHVIFVPTNHILCKTIEGVFRHLPRRVEGKNIGVNGKNRMRSWRKISNEMSA